MPGTLYITGDADADRLLNADGNALLIGMLLDQQVPMEWAFAGPATLKQRLGHLDPKKIAAMDVDDFVAVCCEKPAIHRFPAAMGRRIRAMCAVVCDDHDGRPDVEVKADILARIRRTWTVVAAVDDNPSVVGLWRSHGIPTHVVPGWDD